MKIKDMQLFLIKLHERYLFDTNSARYMVTALKLHRHRMYPSRGQIISWLRRTTESVFGAIRSVLWRNQRRSGSHRVVLVSYTVEDFFQRSATGEVRPSQHKRRSGSSVLRFAHVDD